MAESIKVSTEQFFYRGWHLMDESVNKNSTFVKAFDVESNILNGVWVTDSEQEALSYCKNSPYAVGVYKANKELNILDFNTWQKIEKFVDTFKDHKFLGEPNTSGNTHLDSILNLINCLQNGFTTNCHEDHVLGKFFKKCVGDTYHGFKRQSFSASNGNNVSEYYIIYYIYTFFLEIFYRVSYYFKYR